MHARPFITIRARYRDRGTTVLEALLAVAILAIIVAVGVPAFQQITQGGKNKDAVADMRVLETRIQLFRDETRRYPDTLAELGRTAPDDPWGNPYEYLNIANVKGKGKLRKDKNLVPINTDFDLYSKGPDGKSVSPLTAKHSRDDIVRANNGAFFGVASDY